MTGKKEDSTTNSKLRTDLALEVREIWQQSAEKTTTLPGVRARSEKKDGFLLETVEILDAEGENALKMPRGRYITLSLDALLRREEDAFPRAACVLADELRGLLGMGTRLQPDACVLVVGLGNRAITPDALGPLALENVMITRHLREALPEHFGAFRPVAGICSGVLGTTGLESGDLTAAVTAKLRPAAVIAVDAIASRASMRLCRTVQLSDAGIVPGSGVGNARRALNEKTLEVPVISIGVPTVVSSGTLVSDLSGGKIDPAGLGEDGEMIVTTRDIDKSVRDCARLVGYAINLALHEGLTIEDVDMFLS